MKRGVVDIDIAIIRRGDLGLVDGVNRFIFTLADGFEKLGRNVVVIGHHVTGDLRELRELFSVDVDVRVIGDNSDSSSGYIKYMWDWYTRGSRLLSEIKPEMIIVNGVVPLRYRGIKIAVNHGDAIFELREDLLKRIATRRLYSTYDYTVCTSSKVLYEMREVGIYCHEVIPLPLRLEMYKPETSREKIVIHVGTSTRKNPEISIKTIEILRDMGYDVKLVLIGNYRVDKEWVIVKNRCPDIDLRKLYSEAFVSIHPSTWEGFSYSALEAQASGTPVVVGPGVPDEALIEGKTGFKIRSYDPREYAEKIKLLLEDEYLWSYMSREARKYAENFDHVKITTRYLEIEKIVKSSKHHHV